MELEKNKERHNLRDVGVRYLTPQNCHLYIGTLGSLHCVVDDKEAYANVHCLMTFPISQPYSFISVCYSDDEGKEQEIGVVETLESFSDELQKLIRESLGRQYFEQKIQKIYERQARAGDDRVHYYRSADRHRSAGALYLVWGPDPEYYRRNRKSLIRRRRN